MASDFRTTQEQKLWDQLSKELDDVEKLSTPQAMTRAIGTLGLVSARVPMTVENERSLKNLLGKMRDSMNRDGSNKAKMAQEQRELTASVRSFVSYARINNDKERAAAAQFALKQYRERLQDPTEKIRKELIALRATTDDAQKTEATYQRREQELKDTLQGLRLVIEDVNAGLKAEAAGITNVVETERRIATAIAGINERLATELRIEVDTSGIPRPEAVAMLIDKVDKVAVGTQGVRAGQVNIADHIAAMQAKIRESTEEASRTNKLVNNLTAADKERERAQTKDRSAPVSPIIQTETVEAPASLPSQVALTKALTEAVTGALADHVAPTPPPITLPPFPPPPPITLPPFPTPPSASEIVNPIRDILKEHREEDKAERRQANGAAAPPAEVSSFNTPAGIISANQGLTGMTTAPGVFDPDTNNLNQYDQEKVDGDRRTFLSLFSRLVDNVSNLTRGNGEESSGGFLTKLFAALGVGKLLGLGGKGGVGKKGMMTAIGTGVAGIAAKLGGRFSGLFQAAKGMAGRLLGPGVMTAVKTILKRGVFAIPVVGTLLGAIMMGLDTDIGPILTDWLGPTISSIATSVGNGLASIGAYLSGSAFEDITKAYSEYAPAAEAAVRNMMGGVNDVLYQPFLSLRQALSTYAEKWKDIPVLSTTMKQLDTLFNDPAKAAGDLFKQMQGSGTQNMDTLNQLLRELSQGKSFSELTATQDTMASLSNLKTTLQDWDTQATNWYNGSVTSFRGKVGELYNTASDTVASKWQSAKDTGAANIDSIKRTASSTWDSTKQAVSGGAQSLIDQAKGMASSAYDTLSEAAGALYTMGGSVNIANLDGGFSNALLGAFSEYQEAGGKHRVVLTSGYRSLTDQERLHKESPGKAAPPGRSLHQFGLALDADRTALGEMDRMGILAKYGLERPFASEPWHVQPIGLTDPAAKAGIFSSDQIPSQGKSIMFESTTARPMATPVPSVGMSNMKDAPAPVAEKSEGSGKRSSASSAASQAHSVENIPKYMVNDNGFLATNLGVLAP